MNQDKSRREFLAAGILTTLAVSCNSKKSPFPEDNIVASGEKVKLLSVDGNIIEVDKAFLKPVPHLPAVSNEEARKGIPGKKFVMVIDLSRCKNVKACQDFLQSCTPCTGCTELDKGLSYAGCRTNGSLLGTHHVYAL